LFRYLLSVVYVCCLILRFFFFFFSSRRRHTRSKRDWSSDVCSSDLIISFLEIPLYSLPYTLHNRESCLLHCFSVLSHNGLLIITLKASRVSLINYRRRKGHVHQ